MNVDTIYIILFIGASVLFAAIILRGRARHYGVSYDVRHLGGFITGSIIGILAFFISTLFVDLSGPGFYRALYLSSGIGLIFAVIAGVVGFLLTGRYLEKK
jgi:hypothetical protein